MHNVDHREDSSSASMALTQQQFENLVDRLESDADRSPTLYKLKLGVFALLGYFYIAAILLLLLAAAGLIVAVIIAGKSAVLVKLIIPIVVLIGLVLKSLWIKLAAPQGRRTTKREHPRLFAVIDEVRRAAGAPRAHEVQLTNDLNAAIVQVPRLGLFGWHKNYLILGLPLLQIMSLDEFKAVLAHEFGHLSGAHGRFGAWIYRVRAGWSRLSESLQRQEHWGQFLFVPFFNWYAPRFAAYSFVQARQQEYEADRLAAETVGAGALANALVRLNLKGEDLERSYWPSIFKAADDQPTPNVTPFRGLMSAERRGFLPEAAEQLRQALERTTSTADTHPSLRDRLAALRRPAAVPGEIACSAAEALFGAQLDELAAQFDRDWSGAVDEWWRNRHAHVQNGRAKLEALATKHEQLNDVELYEYALLVEEFEERDKAFEIYKTLVLERGAKQGAKYAYARLLLEQDGNAAIALLEEVMRDMPEATLPACDLIVGYLHAHGRQKEAQPYIDRYYARQHQEHKARAARETVRTTDVYLPATLSDQSKTALTALLARHRKEIKAAYVVRKRTAEGEAPLHVVGILRRSPFYKLESSDAYRRLIHQLAAQANVKEELLFIGIGGEHKGFIKAFKRVAGSRVV
jgi:Zn-dependent protease with chaperone function